MVPLLLIVVRLVKVALTVVLVVGYSYSNVMGHCYPQLLCRYGDCVAAAAASYVVVVAQMYQ